MKVVEAAQINEYVGEDMGASEWFTIDQGRINDFAAATLDHQFIHVDPERAKATPFGTTIAHGYLTLSLLPYLQTSIDDFLVPRGMKMGMNYGFDKIRFLNPVKAGTRVRGRLRMIVLSERRRGLQPQGERAAAEARAGERFPPPITSV